MLPAEIQRNPVEPRRELRALLELREVPERRRDRLLDDVLRLAAHHHRHETRERVPMRRHQGLEVFRLHYSYLFSRSWNDCRVRRSPRSLSSRSDCGGTPSLSAWSKI